MAVATSIALKVPLNESGAARTRRRSEVGGLVVVDELIRRGTCLLYRQFAELPAEALRWPRTPAGRCPQWRDRHRSRRAPPEQPSHTAKSLWDFRRKDRGPTPLSRHLRSLQSWRGRRVRARLRRRRLLLPGKDLDALRAELLGYVELGREKGAWAVVRALNLQRPVPAPRWRQRRLAWSC